MARRCGLVKEWHQELAFAGGGSLLDWRPTGNPEYCESSP